MEKILAPVPGKVIAISVTAGQKVSAGQTIMTLETMKMENPILCRESGVVAEILVSEGSIVSPSQPMVIIN
ncbi:MAG TPA: acetyl-CoA carboxylase biotin carboxyl carrier protein subunit [Selenomonadales bacterium]|nr:acetyl-CoA carboxylase biotin carboxyl carrier protein subunit [Selenomonadales bacterium]